MTKPHTNELSYMIYVLTFHGNYVATVGHPRIAYGLAERHGYTVTAKRVRL